jgi:hypothetical protein
VNSIMMVVHEVTKPSMANFCIFVARLHMKDLIYMSNTSAFGVWEAPMHCLFKVINKKKFLIGKNLQPLAS